MENLILVDSLNKINESLNKISNNINNLNKVKEYDKLLEENIKQNEVIDKINLIIKGIAYGEYEDYYIEKINEINRLLKEVLE